MSISKFRLETFNITDCFGIIYLENFQSLHSVTMIHRDVNVEAVLGPEFLPTVLAGVDEEVWEVYGLNMIHNIRLVRI